MGDCLFCAVVAGTAPASVVLDEPLVVGFLDVRPVFKGHVLLVPRAHVPALPDLPDELLGPFFTAVRRVARAVPEAYDAQGTFTATNTVVSQSVPHLHVHVVPRMKGDGLRGFFWPRTRYSSEAEAETYAARLRAVLAADGEERA